ncbi:UDP-4-amino-4,6-dideoxy-N-acetyl-beta-L-altrosamine transaminase [Candidatus Parcubacteria bacterium]|nr:UDP-4-amino-4,6-dideoxy-N-acetyl-beta-L-altrosamine transaminase [Candidatus Parcubacteria bacterium]
MIPYGKQTIEEEDINAVVDVFKTNWLTQGPKIKEFEEKVAQYCGAKYAVACSNGTSALHLAYLSAGLKQGDEVITTPNTFAATSNMILAVGASPVFCDIRLDTYNIDENKIEDLIAERTKAIVPVHFAGHSCEMNKIYGIAKKHNLIVIEDACHALGARHGSSKVGSCGHSDMSVFSFHPVKPITTGEGGVITTNNEELYKKLITFRNHGIHKDEQGKNVMTELGFNYRITDIQTALGVSQLKKLDQFIEKRRQVAEWYEEELKDLEEIILPSESPNNYSGWHLYIIRTANPEDRDKLKKYLSENEIGVNFHYPAVYSHPYYQNLGYGEYKDKCKNEEIYHNSCITLSCYPTLERSEVKYICDLIKTFFNKPKSIEPTNRDQQSFDAYNEFMEKSYVDRFTKIFCRYDLFKLIKDIPGDIAECGVYKGQGVLFWARLLEIFNPLSIRKVVGFDTFKGMPETVKSQADRSKIESFKNYEYVPDMIKNQAKELKIKDSRIEIVAGDALESIPEYVKNNPGFRIALLNLDFDVYEPTLAALENLYDLVIPGGIVCLDEYAVHNWRESDAFDEFIKKRNLKVELKTIPWALSPTAYFIKP